MVATRLTPEQRLARDVAAVLARHRDLLAFSGGRTDASRLFVVMSIAQGAEQHLPRSLPRLLGQTRALGRAVDLLIGCNNGFESRALFDFINRYSGCRIIHGYCAKSLPNEPAPIVDREGRPLLINAGSSGEDRCFLIHQCTAANGREGAAAGKIRMLGDLYDWIERSIMAGWQPPRLLLACDAETEIDCLAPWSGEGVDEPGLAILIERLETDATLHLVGTRNRFMAFEADDSGIHQPSTDLPVPAIQLYLNLVHARVPGFMWMPGGGTLGYTEAMTALLATIARYYPGVRSEDTMTSVLAHAAGFDLAFEQRVASLNRCASVHEGVEATRQMERWIASSKDLEIMYGGATTGYFIPASVTSVVLAGLRLTCGEFMVARNWSGRIGVMRNGGRILHALPEYLRIRRTVPPDRSDDLAFQATW